MLLFWSRGKFQSNSLSKIVDNSFKHFLSATSQQRWQQQNVNTNYAHYAFPPNIKQSVLFISDIK